MGKVIFLVAIASVLVGCNPLAVFRPSEAEQVRYGWYESSARPLVPRYCYRTLAEVDCFAEPQLDEAGRQVGSFHALAD